MNERSEMTTRTPGLRTLEHSYKKIYPFRLGTTSFIYPDLYSENVRLLGPYLDEIELLFFESRDPGCFPSTYEIDELLRLKNRWDLTYNIHLPTDVDLSSPDPHERETAVSNLEHVIEMTEPLKPVTYTLHIPFDSERPGGETLWRAYASKGIRALLSRGVQSRKISVETLMYPPLLLKPLVDEFDLSICLDVGHVMLAGGDPLEVFREFRDRISIIHLHGVRNQSDHLSLDHFDAQDFSKIRHMLNDFTETVSIEVFSFKDLELSLSYLREYF